MRIIKVLSVAGFAVACTLLPAGVSSAQSPQEVVVANGPSGVDSVSVSGLSAIVGSPEASPPSVSFLSESNGTWSVTQAIDASRSPGFGYSVAMSGNLAVVGAPEPSGKGGRMFVYSDTGGKWKKVFGASKGTGAFGYSVAASNGAVVVGDPGSTRPGQTYVYEDIKGTWSSTQLIRPRNTQATPKATLVGFGTDVSIYETTAPNGTSDILVASPGTSGTGEVTLYGSETLGTAWSYPSSEGETSDVGGVAMSEVNAEAIATAGSVVIYNNSDAVQTLSPPAPESGCDYGEALSLAPGPGAASPGTLLVSDPSIGSACAHASTVYVYSGSLNRTSPTWVLSGTVTASDGAHPLGSTIPASTDGTTEMIGGVGVVYVEPVP